MVSWNRCEERVRGMVSGKEWFWGMVSWNGFGLGMLLGNALGECLLGMLFGNAFGEYFWGMVLGNDFEEYI